MLQSLFQVEKAFVFAHQRANGFSSLQASLASCYCQSFISRLRVSAGLCVRSFASCCCCCHYIYLLLLLRLLDSIVELCFLRRGRSEAAVTSTATMLHLAFRLVMNNWVLSYFYSSILPFLCALLSRNDSTVKNLKKKAFIQIIVGDSKKRKQQHKTRSANYKRFCKFFATEHEQKLWKICEMSSKIIRRLSLLKAFKKGGSE